MAEDRTLSHFVGHKMPAVGELAWDCMQSVGHHLDNADPQNDVEDLEDPGVVDGEGLGGLGAVDGGVVVGAQGQKVDPRFAFGQDWLKHETVVETETPEVTDAVTYGRQLVGERMRLGGVDGQPLASCCATVGGLRRKAFGGKRPDGKAAAAVVGEVAVAKCKMAGFD